MTTITLTSPATDNTLTTCPAWCGELHEDQDSPCFGGLVDIELPEAEPAFTLDGPATTYASVELWQHAGGAPIIALAFGPAAELADAGLPDLSLDEAERLADALKLLVRRAKIG